MKNFTPFKLMELTFAAPFVMTQRLTQLSTTGSHTARNNQEVYRMWSEKILAFSRSQNAVWLEGIRYQQNMLVSLTNYWLHVWWNPKGNWQTSLKQSQRATEQMMSKGLSPIHRTVVANARRLSKVG